MGRIPTLQHIIIAMSARVPKVPKPFLATVRGRVIPAVHLADMLYESAVLNGCV